VFYNSLLLDSLTIAVVFIVSGIHIDLVSLIILNSRIHMK